MKTIPILHIPVKRLYAALITAGVVAVTTFGSGAILLIVGRLLVPNVPYGLLALTCIAVLIGALLASITARRIPESWWD